MICGTLFAAWCLMYPVATDGDTFWAHTPWGRQGFRIWGLSAPEMTLQGPDGKCLKDASGRCLPDPEGLASKEHLDRLIRNHTLACNTAGPPSMSREVVSCVRVLDQVDLACQQVATGHGHDWPTYSGGHYANCRSSD